MISRTVAEIAEALRLIETIRNSGSLGDDSYHKCLVSLGFEYLVAGETNKGLLLILKVPSDYYRLVQLQQMEEDSMYRDLVIGLGYKLVQLGLAQGTEEIYPPTQPPGNA